MNKWPITSLNELMVLAFLAMMQSACTTLDRDVPRSSTTALSDDEMQGTALGRAWRETESADPALSAFRLLPNSLEAFAARVALIDAAERTLDLQYYIFKTDEVGLFLVDRLVAAADRGVRVRILLDDLDSHGVEKGLATFDAHANIEVRLFNPWTQRSGKFVRGLEFLFAPRLNHRMHNKLFIADGITAILGGRNLADEYFDLSAEFEFRDLDVAAAGPVVHDANELFDGFWNGPDAIPVAGLSINKKRDAEIKLQNARQRLAAHREHMQTSPYAEAVRATDLVQQLKTRSIQWIFASGRVIGDSFLKTASGDKNAAPTLADQLRELFFSAENELLICSPYFVPGKKATARLGELVAGGAQVRILTNSRSATDVPLVHAGYSKYRKKLLTGGVELFELRRLGATAATQPTDIKFGSAESSLHAKTFVVDRKQAFIGSLNLDPRSVVINTEIGVLIDSPELAQRVAGSITTLMQPEWSYRLGWTDDNNLGWFYVDQDGQPMHVTTDPETSWWDRFMNGVLRLLPIESQI